MDIYVECYKQTEDNWYPSYITQYSDQLVHLSFFNAFRNDELVWVAYVSGGDDCAIEKSFHKESDAWQCFVEILGWGFVNMKPLQDIGFNQGY